MLGAIIGDIVGSIYEFDNIKTKDFELFDRECFFTDDTVMSVAVAEATAAAIFLARNGASKQDIREYIEKEFS